MYKTNKNDGKTRKKQYFWIFCKYFAKKCNFNMQNEPAIQKICKWNMQIYRKKNAKIFNFQHPSPYQTNSHNHNKSFNVHSMSSFISSLVDKQENTWSASCHCAPFWLGGRHNPGCKTAMCCFFGPTGGAYSQLMSAHFLRAFFTSSFVKAEVMVEDF